MLPDVILGKNFSENNLLIASSNAGKISEIRELLSSLTLNAVVHDTRRYSITAPEENGRDFIANAVLKAMYYGKETGYTTLADDSGLCIPALGGDPGIHSARWAKDGKDFNSAMEKIHTLLREKSPSAKSSFPAYFVCALALYWPTDHHVEYSEGKLHGTLTFPPRGKNGFGYDPIFIPHGYQHTLAELYPSEKQKISHRFIAFEDLKRRCFTSKK